MTYCEYAPGHPDHGPYHDLEYGVPTDDETVLFERLALEIEQAGLSWGLVLRKRAALRELFAGFRVDRVASFGPAEIARVLADPRGIRNRAKTAAIVHNARVVAGLRATHGSFAGWLAAHHPRPKEDWVRLFRRTFRFTGGEITGEFLLSIGYLPGAHVPECPAYARIAALEPPWRAAGGT